MKSRERGTGREEAGEGEGKRLVCLILSQVFRPLYFQGNRGARDPM